MNQLWKKSVPLLTRTSPMYFEGALVKDNHLLKYYFFSSLPNLSEITFHAETGEQISYKCNVSDVPKNQQLYSTRKPPKHYECDDFVFDDYTIAHQGAWGYVCTKNSNLLWKRSLKGYLYTDILRNGDRITFGTAGYGGHFYSLDINSGEIVFDFNTKGTSAFFHVNDGFYFASRNRKSTDIYKIDAKGNVLDILGLEGAYHDTYCPIALWDQSIYVVTLLESKDEKFTPIVHRIEL